MKKILIVISVAIIMALFSAPSFAKAAQYVIGQAYVHIASGQYAGDYNLDIYTLVDVAPTYVTMHSGGYFYANDQYQIYYVAPWNNSQTPLYKDIQSGYIDSLTVVYEWSYNGTNRKFYSEYTEYVNTLPEDIRPEEPTLLNNIWDSFYDLYEFLFGYRPMPGSIYDLLRGNADGEDNEIIFPTLTPTPSPTPTPTPIPVQTIFVPDGNGNTTIIYQYPDPTSGVITQSPYNPNIHNNITIDCNCDGDGGGSGTFTSNPQDPYSLDASLLWADGFGVEMSENPLQATEEQQATLKEAAMEYDGSVQVMSNSFNVLPVKWIVLAGLLGGIMIIAGLIRTFLGG